MNNELRTGTGKFFAVSLFFVVVFSLLLPRASFAATLDDCPPSGPNPGTICLLGYEIKCDPSQDPSSQSGCGFAAFIMGARIVIGFITEISLLIGFIMIAIGGGYIMLSGGSGGIKTGLAIIKAAVVGVAIILAAWLMIATIFRILPKSPVGTKIEEQLF